MDFWIVLHLEPWFFMVFLETVWHPGNFWLQSGSILQRKAIDRLMLDFLLVSMNFPVMLGQRSALPFCGLFRIIAIPRKIEKRHPTKILANYLSICLGITIYYYSNITIVVFLL